MSGGGGGGGVRRGTARSRARASTTSPPESSSSPSSRHIKPSRAQDRRDHLRLPDLSVRTLIALSILSLSLLSLVALGIYHYADLFDMDDKDRSSSSLMRLVTPLSAPKMMDLPQFQGEHKESLYWGTYRPQYYLGIRARTPRSLVAGLLWIGGRSGNYKLRHTCQDSDGITKYGWTEHNGRDYGRQAIEDHGLLLTTSFLKDKANGSGYGGDWALRIETQNNYKSRLDETEWSSAHIFFYVADEEGNSLSIGKENLQFSDGSLLASGERSDVGGWEVHLESVDNVDFHYSGIRTQHMHNLSDLLGGLLQDNGERTGRLELPDLSEDSANLIFFQISTKLPSKIDLAFISGTDSKSSRVRERISNLRGTMLTNRLNEKQHDFEKKYDMSFNVNDKVEPKAVNAGRAALANLLGGIGYSYGRSKIALPKGFSQENGDKFISYWPAALFTAVPSRSLFPRGFLWDEGFHQLIIWRWDISISLDIIGHWLDLLNVDGWIPREQILGAEALSKVPSEFVLQHSTNGNPPTLFIALRDLVSYTRSGKLSMKETKDISAFLDRAYARLEAWFQWFNNTQAGKDINTFYWHGRDSMTTKELNPKTLSSGLDDYPRASHPSNEERHLDLRCWMLLAADCMQSIGEHLKMDDSFKNDYHMMVRRLSDSKILNQLHLDDVSGVYFDYGNHTEKVRLRWHEVNDGGIMKREFVRETLEKPQLMLVPHVGYVNLFPFMMGIIPPASRILEKQLELISNRSILWTDYGLRSLSQKSSMYMKRNTEHDPPYWRGPIWINMNYMILSALHHYSQENGPYQARAGAVYKELRSNLIRNIVRNYYETGYLWEQYDGKNKGKGKGAHPFTGWTSLVLLIMAEDYPRLHINFI